jgi:CRISPR/Cas system-associated exonuclease Cas4 (RecB family)
MQEDLVSASEIGEFCYCKRAWWLRYHGRMEQTDTMKRGVVNHDKLAWKVHVFYRLKMLGYILVSVGITGIIVYILLKFYFSVL